MTSPPAHTNRKVLITGGTGSIGKILVEQFAARYEEVFFQYHSNESEALRLAERSNVTAMQLDLLNAPQLPRVDFDIVINSAAVLLAKTPVHEITDGEYLDSLTINTVAPFRIVREILPGMVARTWGRIINIGSIYSLRATTNNGSYNVSKHGLTGLTRSLALDYAHLGITANEVCPSAVESDIMNNIAVRREGEGKGDSRAFLDEVRAANPVGRMASADDIAAACLFFASEEAAFVNGISLAVDGGQIVSA